ncbi:MAG: LytTR family DNA-binding domain-containing protein [Pseudomonadota bacterium]
MKVVLVDDEPLARDRLRALLADIGQHDIAAEGGNGQQAIELTQAHQPDVLFLDIRMPGMDGIEAANHLARLEAPPAVIFTTAYDEHALAAFDANAIDYLLKPIRADRLAAAVKKAQALSAPQVETLNELPSEKRQHVSGMANGNLVVVDIAEVAFFQSDQGYTRVVWAEGELLIEDSLKALEEEFAEQFIRVHRNTLVAVNQVAEIGKESSGNQFVRLRGVEETLPVSRRMVGGLRKRIRELK